MANEDSKAKFVQALELLLKKKPLAKITVAEICKESGLSRQTFYRHFLDIYDLANYSHKYLDQLSSLIFVETHNIEESIFYTLESLQKNQNLFKRISRDDHQNSFFAYFCQAIQDDQIDYIGKDNLSDIDLLALKIYAFGATQAIFAWIQGEIKCPARTLAKCISESYPNRLSKFYTDRKK